MILLILHRLTPHWGVAFGEWWVGGWLARKVIQDSGSSQFGFMATGYFYMASSYFFMASVSFTSGSVPPSLSAGLLMSLPGSFAPSLFSYQPIFKKATPLHAPCLQWLRGFHCLQDEVQNPLPGLQALCHVLSLLFSEPPSLSLQVPWGCPAPLLCPRPSLGLFHWLWILFAHRSPGPGGCFPLAPSWNVVLLWRLPWIPGHLRSLPDLPSYPPHFFLPSVHARYDKFSLVII